MTKKMGTFAGMAWGRRFYTGLIALLLVIALIGGMEAFVPVAELSDLDDAVSVDAVLAEEQLSERSSVVARVGGVSVKNERSVPALAGATQAGPSPVEGQVVSKLRNSGMRRAVPPTGPPVAQA